jgi:hypothetical protein
MALRSRARNIDKADRLPLRSDGILNNERIRCEQHTIVLNGLADQHPIERIAMQRGKFVQVKHGPFFERQNRYPMHLPLRQQKPIKGSRQRKLSQRMFHRDLPHRHDTKQDLMGRICKHLRRSKRKLSRARDDPQEGACIEKTPHTFLPSKASSMSSGSGSKKDAGAENVCFANPIGRGRVGTSDSGVICATG